MLRAKIIVMEIDRIKKEIDNLERQGSHSDPERQHQTTLKELRMTGLKYTKQALEYNRENRFENPVYQILLPPDLVYLESLQLKAEFELQNELYEDAAKSLT